MIFIMNLIITNLINMNLTNKIGNIFVKLIMKIILRWDCEESSQIWASCSDVKIKPKIRD